MMLIDVHVGTWRLKGNGNVGKRLKDMIMKWLFIKIKHMAFQTHNCTNANQTKKFNVQTVKSSFSDLWTSL